MVNRPQEYSLVFREAKNDQHLDYCPSPDFDEEALLRDMAKKAKDMTRGCVFTVDVIDETGTTILRSASFKVLRSETVPGTKDKWGETGRATHDVQLSLLTPWIDFQAEPAADAPQDAPRVPEESVPGECEAIWDVSIQSWNITMIGAPYDVVAVIPRMAGKDEALAVAAGSKPLPRAA